MATHSLKTSTVMPKHRSFPRELPGAAALAASWRDIDFQAGIEAIERLDFEKIQKLLSQRSDLGLLRRDGQTLLSKVAASDAVNIAEFLLPFSDIAAVDNKGETALSRALFHAQPEMARFLTENGAPCAWPNPLEFDAMMICAIGRYCEDGVKCARIVAPLCDAAFVPATKTMGAFEWAVSRGRHQIAKAIWECQSQATQERMSERWLNALLEQTWGSGSFRTEIEGDGAAFWALIDQLACMRPEACAAFLERTRADARDLPRFFATKEARELREALPAMTFGAKNASAQAVERRRGVL